MATARCTVLWLLMMFCGIVHCRNINDGNQNKECTLDESNIYNYTDSNGNEIVLPHSVHDGLNVTVKCKYPSVYDIYDDGGEAYENITCENGIFTDVSMICSDQAGEETSNSCKEFKLRNGLVNYYDGLGEYYVSCNLGYTLNLPQYGTGQPCQCTEGELTCFGNKKPLCSPDKCKIPLEIDRRLSIYQLPRRVYLSEGGLIKHNSYVVFNCSNVVEQKYEPATRRFQCKLGQWMEAERNPNWNFGNNGTFPECREAVCDPQCENGGVCFRDGECRCQHLTTGARCEAYLCDERCTRNGGECVKPGICGNCPVSRRGENCEIVIRCDKIKNLYGGDVIYFEDREVGTEVFYSCEDGYTQHPEDLDLSMCTLKGNRPVWVPDPPACFETALIQSPNHGYTDTNEFVLEHGQSYNIFCNQGYEFYRGHFLNKDIITITNNNGTLKPKVPGCKPARCDPLLFNETIVSYGNGTEITDLVPSNTPVLYSCKPGFRFRNKNLGVSVQRKCLYGEFNRVPRCIPTPCTIGDIKLNPYSSLQYYQNSHSFLFPGFEVIHGARITVSCRNYWDYELFVQSTQTFISEFISQCDFGTFDMKDEEFPICLEKRCHFVMPQEYCFWKNDTSSDNCFRGDFYVASKTNMSIRCSDGYTKVNGEADDYPNTTCLQGKYTAWTPFDCRPLPCVVPELDNGEVIQSKSEVESSSNVTFKCKDGYHFTDIPHTTILESMCYLGEWMTAIPQRCHPDSCFIDVTNNTVYTIMESRNNMTHVISSSLVPHGTKLSVRCDEGFEMFDTNKNLLNPTNEEEIVTCGFGIWSNENIFKNVCRKRCLVPDEKRYQYRNAEGTQVDAGELVVDGERLNVICKNLEYDNYDTDDRKYVTCNSGNLSKTDLECSSTDKSDACLVLENGSVELVNVNYHLECNTGYTLDLKQLPADYCMCNYTIGILYCYNQIPVCRPDYCSIPLDYDMSELSVKVDGGDTFLAGGTYVSHGDHVIFDCQPRDGDVYEPKNRRYKCQAGRWILEGNTNGQNDRNGNFPKCIRVPQNCTIAQWTKDNAVSVSDADGKLLDTGTTVDDGEQIEIDCGVKAFRNMRFVCKDGDWQLGNTSLKIGNSESIYNCSVITGLQASKRVLQVVFSGTGK